MEEKINIAAILNDKLNGLRLYSPIFGECEFCYVREDTNDICVKKHNGVIEYFNSEGLYFALGEVMLFPSKEMRDWEKFSWKKGDVLANSRGLKILFDRWANGNYTSFYAKTINLVEDGFLDTNLHTLASEKEAKSFIKCIEERFGGKLNLQTLEIQKKTEFKDGDIITFKDRIIIIYNTSIERSPKRTEIYYHACLKEGELTVNEYLMSCGFGEGWYSSTEEEKHNLFEALAKKCKRWDSEKKQIVDLKPKVELKPFDKVLSRRCSKDYWVLNFYSHKTDYYHICIDGSSNLYCIPYNEETAHLLGTTDDWEGGEG